MVCATVRGGGGGGGGGGINLGMHGVCNCQRRGGGGGINLGNAWCVQLSGVVST